MVLNRRLLCLVPLVLIAGCATAPPPASLSQPGEKAPSEDPLILDFHPLGKINGQDNLFRSASPIRDMTKAGTYDPTGTAARAAADVRMKSLYARGIRTIISLEAADSSEDKSSWMALEKAAAGDAGLTIVACPLANSGPDSFQVWSDQTVLAKLQAISDEIMKAAKNGGVDIHCSAGHDRTGIVVAFLRLKYQHWTADGVIAEMRFYGHNWPKLSANGGASSWHEDHLRAIARMLSAGTP